MESPRRYLIAALAATLLAGGVTLAPDDMWSVPQLVGIAVAVFVAAAYALKYPDAFSSGDRTPNWASGAFGGVATFGAFVLMAGLGSSTHVGAGVLGLALAWAGFATGIGHERE